MKRILAALIIAAAATAAAYAQPKAIGGRFGYPGIEVDYQHYLGAPNFLQIGAGVDLTSHYIQGIGMTPEPGFKASVLYNITIAQPNWTSRGDWSLYAGGGISMGYVYDAGNRVHNGDLIEYARRGYGFMFSFPVQGGISYTFWFPLQLSVEIRPYFGLHTQKGDRRVTGFYNAGLMDFIPSLSVHYAF